MGTVFKSAIKRDKMCRCIRCGEEYLFTIKEQEYFERKGFQKPKRCKMCRKIHKQEMKILNIDNRGKYYGLNLMLPGLYKGNFKGGIDVTDISGKKYKCKSYYGF